MTICDKNLLVASLYDSSLKNNILVFFDISEITKAPVLLETILLEKISKVVSIAPHPNGKHFFLADDAGQISIFDRIQKKIIGTWKVDPSYANETYIYMDGDNLNFVCGSLTGHYSLPLRYPAATFNPMLYTICGIPPSVNEITRNYLLSPRLFQPKLKQNEKLTETQTFGCI